MKKILMLAALSCTGWLATQPALAGVWTANCNNSTSTTVSSGTDSSNNPTFTCGNGDYVNSSNNGSDNDGNGASWTLQGMVTQQVNVVCQIGQSSSVSFPPRSFQVNCGSSNTLIGPGQIPGAPIISPSFAISGSNVIFNVYNSAGNNGIQINDVVCDQAWANAAPMPWPTVNFVSCSSASTLVWGVPPIST